MYMKVRNYMKERNYMKVHQVLKRVLGTNTNKQYVQYNYNLSVCMGQADMQTII